MGNNPLSYNDPLGLTVNDSYPSIDDAGIAAVDESLPPSISQNREYAGVIYQNWGGGYSYTQGNPGFEDRSYPGDAPWLHKEVAIYQTHGQARPGKDTENFSTPNAGGHGDTGLSDALGIPSYLGTPHYKYMKYDPNAACGEKTTILRPGI